MLPFYAGGDRVIGLCDFEAFTPTKSGNYDILKGDDYELKVSVTAYDLRTIASTY